MSLTARIRRELNLKQTEMANIIGVSQSTISRWEDEGSCSLSFDQLMKLRTEVLRSGGRWDDAWLFDERATHLVAAG